MSRTFLPLNDHRDGPLLLCLPHAGGSAASFRAFAADIDGSVVGIELAGRGARFHEQPLTDVDAITSSLARDIPVWVGDRSYVLLGHSLGGLVAFEIARRLRSASGPAAVVVSGVPPPELYSEPARGELTRADLVAELRRLGGTPEEVLRSDEFMDLLLPVVRADLAAAATYRYADAEPLDIPLLALAGAEDPEVEVDAVAGWAAHTTGSCTSHVLPGNHFFLFDPASGAAAAVSELVAHLAAGRTA